MALTEYQYQNLFEVLEIPYTSDGTIYSLTQQGDAAYTGISPDSVALQKAYSGVYIWVSGMTASGLAILSGLLTEWDSLGSDTTRIDGGTIGDIGGVTYSASDRREYIAKRIRIRVPYYRAQDAIRRSPSGPMVFST
jgi:hypothetical protein